MYSKHRQKNGQISTAKCGHLLVFLSFLFLSSALQRASGNNGEQGKEYGLLYFFLLPVARWSVKTPQKSETRRSLFQRRRQMFDTFQTFLRIISSQSQKANFHISRSLMPRPHDAPFVNMDLFWDYNRLHPKQQHALGDSKRRLSHRLLSDKVGNREP